ncbi:hypothetical protein UA08_02812 [Talaromyces atroroseus]|uniref:Ureidoglycolate hydrolase n=1 Tax=Talaromyces atroroseus TaxID=1441469 RepID=A0A225AJQ0_TALAT|nr:hypothetical protein UA08_02812 [Talaromyces atroroseus]OKL61741.1 hypothetical protein UA08_02812 [Talaromyces atroroseus]
MCELHITAEPLHSRGLCTVWHCHIQSDSSRCQQGTARGSNSHPASVFTCSHTPSHAPSGVQAEPYCSFFSSFPREPRTAVQVDCLERHPYTKQTFVPIAIPAGASNSPQSTISSFLVVVAPTTTAIHEAIRVDDIHEKNSSSATNAPDLLHLKAFIAHGSQAISYNAGTWHAPMIVLGDIRVDFLVLQYANRVKKEDSIEAYRTVP